MADVRTATVDLLAEKPELEGDLKRILAVDAEHETWTFDDVPLDSGGFGELVSRGIIENVDGEYRVADRDAVLAAVGGREMTPDSEERSERSPSASGPDNLTAFVPKVEFDQRVAFALTGALALVVLFRVIPYPAVFRGSDVVLSGNDPYLYRYIVHGMLDVGTNPLDLSVLSSLPSGMEHGEPLMVATLWWVSALLGGASAVGGVLAWYPVVSAVVTALLVYVLTVRVTEDKRAGIAAVALLAIIPAHAFRTGLGFADHHAFDYPWLALTALAVVSLAGKPGSEWQFRDGRTWVWALVLGVGVGGQTLAWDAGPLLLVPLALYALMVVPSWLRADRSPIVAGWPLIVGTGVGALLVVWAHVSFGWHTQAVVAAPALLVGGMVVLLSLGESAKRVGVSVLSLVGIEVGSLIGGILVLRAVFPPFVAEIDRGLDFLFLTEGIAETTSLFSGPLGTIVGPILLFGFGLFLAVPYLAWASWRAYRSHASQWLLASVYGWYFLLLALIQIRFAGQLALFAAVLGGLGFVHVAAWVDLTPYPPPFVADEPGSLAIPAGSTRSSETSPSSWDEAPEPGWLERREAMYTAVWGFGVGSLGMLMTPIKHSQLTVDGSMYEAAQFMREYSEERGWEYPENYVFSDWGRNRVYNWSVNGESKSYSFARNNFREFLASADGEEWYHRLRDRVGFVVVDGDGPSGGDQTRTLHEQLQSERFGIETDHYRALWPDRGNSRRIYTLVPGAQVTGPAPANSTVSVEGTVDIDDRSTSVEMETQVGEHGVYRETIPLPGRYEIGDTSVTVTADDVTDGAIRSAFEGEGYAYWPFDEGSGNWVYDRAGGHHGRIHGPEWTDEGRSGSALSFEGKSTDYVEAPVESLQAFTISLWAYPTALDVLEANDYREVVRTSGGSILIFEQNGGISFRLPGSDVDRLVGGGIETETWNHVVVTFDGSIRTMYIDGDERAQDEVAVDSLEWGDRLRLGNGFNTPSEHGYAGLLDGVRIYREVIPSAKREALVISQHIFH